MILLRHCLLALLILVSVPAQAAGDDSWFYRGSDIPPDPAWIFGTLPNGVRYAVRQNPLPAGQVSIRVRIDAGSLHEEDHERGWAHFTEHMAFRGTKSFGDREARHIWQKFGASFGSDTNASTSANQTVYQLDLPRADAASLDTSLKVMSEMVDSALFDPALVEAEKKVIIAEKGRRPELTTKLIETSWPLFYAGLRFAERDPIGTDETLKGATAEGLRGFYERWYRPERATVIMVGDADPKLMEQLIARHFGEWKGKGPAPADPDYGTIRTLQDRAAILAYPGAPQVLSVAWLRPYRAEPDTKAREQADFATSLAERIINRRFQAKARGEASLINAALGQSRNRNMADVTQLSITAKEGRWRDALNESFAIVSDAVAAPPSEAEIRRELQNTRIAATAAVEGEATVKSQQRAQQLVNALDSNSVVATAETSLAMIDEFAPRMTPALVGEAMKQLFAGAGPRAMLLSPAAEVPAALDEALAQAERTAPAVRQAEREVTIDDLPPLGTPGREVSRQAIEDLEVTIVRFANGSTLTHKRTDFEKGSVAVQLRFGGGMAAIDPEKPSLEWLGGLVGPSGLADLDLDGLERLLTGRRMGMSFGIDEDAFVLRGQTNGTDLGDQLRLLATKIAYPRWDPLLFERFRANALQGYDLAFTSATARAGREMAGFTRRGDERWDPVEREEIATADIKAFQAFLEPLMSDGPVEGVIVGDVDLETAIKAFARTVGALPERPGPYLPQPALEVRPPAPSPQPVTFTHQGDKDEAYALIGWNTFGGIERNWERRALALAANMLQVRLFDRLREAEGATYSPSAISTTSDTFADWGIFYAAAEIRPESADTFFRIAREVVADLAAKPAGADEFARAQTPVLTGIERRLKTNAYWLKTMEGWPRRPELIEQTRTFMSDYQRMTAEDVRKAVAAHVAEEGDWSMLVVPGAR